MGNLGIVASSIKTAPPFIPIAFVQQKGHAAVASATNVITLDASSVAGNCLVACSINIGAQITGISGGGTWSLAKLTPGNVCWGEIWICPDATAVTVITVTYANGTWDSAVNVSEFSTVMLASPLGPTNNNFGTSTSPTTGAVLPLTANALVVGMAVSKGAYSAGPTGGFTGLTRVAAANSGDPASVMPGYLIQTTAASANPGWTIGSAPWDGAAVVLKRA